MHPSAIKREDYIDKGKEEEPDNINKVPIPSRRFEAEMLLRFEPALKKAKITDQEEDSPD